MDDIQKIVIGCREKTNITSLVDDIKTNIDNASFKLEEYDDVLVRKIVECIKIINQNEIAVTFKGSYEVKSKL